MEREEHEEANEHIKKLLSLSEHKHDAYGWLLKGQLGLSMAQFYMHKHAMRGGDKAASQGNTETQQRAHVVKEQVCMRICMTVCTC